MTPKPQILSKNGIPEFAILRYEDYINLIYPTRIKISGRRTSAEERKCTLCTCAPEVTMFDEPGSSFVKGITKLENSEDMEAIITARNDKSERFPLEVVNRIACGENPVKVFREYRKMAQSTLADKVKVSKQYISQIENFERNGTARILKAIARALDIDLDHLVI